MKLSLKDKARIAMRSDLRALTDLPPSGRLV